MYAVFSGGRDLTCLFSSLNMVVTSCPVPSVSTIYEIAREIHYQLPMESCQLLRHTCPTPQTRLSTSNLERLYGQDRLSSWQRLSVLYTSLNGYVYVFS